MTRYEVLLILALVTSPLVVKAAASSYDADADYDGLFAPPQAQAPAVLSSRPRAPQPQPQPQRVTVAQDEVHRVLDLVNAYRQNQGLGALVLSDQLNGMAMNYARALYAANSGSGFYLTHDLPGFEFNTRVYQEGLSSISNVYEENIAAGATSADDVMSEWMASPGHEQNILDGNVRYIGIAHYGHFWVQDFAQSVTR